jgi:DNA-3-methyladenine glycosylase I
MTMSDEAKPGLVQGEDGALRCWWHGNLPDYQRYHDEEWGRPVTDDIRLFEKLCLEGFQSGLSWLTILRKRENFRAAFHGFDFDTLADEEPAAIEAHLANAGIIRHRGKIASVYNNARRARELREEFGTLAAYFWAQEPAPDERPDRIDRGAIPGKTDISTRISKDLRKRGWSFVGPTTVYAFMQAMGLVNDHLEGCCCRAPVEEARRKLARPAGITAN